VCALGDWEGVSGCCWQACCIFLYQHGEGSGACDCAADAQCVVIVGRCMHADAASAAVVEGFMWCTRYVVLALVCCSWHSAALGAAVAVCVPELRSGLLQLAQRCLACCCIWLCTLVYTTWSVENMECCPTVLLTQGSSSIRLLRCVRCVVIGRLSARQFALQRSRCHVTSSCM
jgi:hypothetical protein